MILFSISLNNIDAPVSIAYGLFRYQLCFLMLGPTSFDFPLHRTMVYHKKIIEKNRVCFQNFIISVDFFKNSIIRKNISRFIVSKVLSVAITIFCFRVNISLLFDGVWREKSGGRFNKDLDIFRIGKSLSWKCCSESGLILFYGLFLVFCCSSFYFIYIECYKNSNANLCFITTKIF